MILKDKPPRKNQINQPLMREKVRDLCIQSSKIIFQHLQVHRMLKSMTIHTNFEELEALCSILNSCPVRMSLLGFWKSRTPWTKQSMPQNHRSNSNSNS